MLLAKFCPSLTSSTSVQAMQAVTIAIWWSDACLSLQPDWNSNSYGMSAARFVLVDPHFIYQLGTLIIVMWNSLTTQSNKKTKHYRKLYLLLHEVWRTSLSLWENWGGEKKNQQNVQSSSNFCWSSWWRRDGLLGRGKTWLKPPKSGNTVLKAGGGIGGKMRRKGRTGQNRGKDTHARQTDQEAEC